MSAAVKAYREKHPYCQACELARHTAEIHHIRTRGAGGDDDPANLLALCREHHGMAHAMGARRFASMAPRLAAKIVAALERPKGVRK